MQEQSTLEKHLVDGNVDIDEAIGNFVANHGKRKKKLIMCNIIREINVLTYLQEHFLDDKPH